MGLERDGQAQVQRHAANEVRRPANRRFLVLRRQALACPRLLHVVIDRGAHDAASAQ